MGPKSEALAAAKKRIVELQAQMTDRILKMAAEVAKLTAVVTEREAREFLRVTCNVPGTELSTYVKFADTLAGHEDVLEKARVSFPVLKALVSADDDARTEIVERMEIGARISTTDISAIRKRLRNARLTPEEVMAKRNGKLIAAAGRQSGVYQASEFQWRLNAFVRDIIEIRDAADFRDENIRETAAELLIEFAHFFGSVHRSPESIKRNTPARDIASAYFALAHLSEGMLAFPADVDEWHPDDAHPWLVALQSLSGNASPSRRVKAGEDSIKGAFNPRPTVVELCAGAGGMAIGFERAGFDHVALVEFDPHAAATLRKNRPDWNVVQADLKTVDFSIYRQLEIDVVAGGLACQPYSIEGKGLGKEDPRDLFPDAVRIVDEIRPRAFVFENVEGLLHGKHNDHMADILRGFRKAGYQTEIHRVQASDYGVAQSRRRVLVIGLRDDLADAFRMPRTFPDRRANVGDILVDLMEANGWAGAREWARQRREHPILGRNGEIEAYGVQAATVVTSRGKRRRNEQAVQTAIGFDATGLPDRAPTQEEASRDGFLPSLTLRMRARLQDFPDNWEFAGGKQSVARQIGNAVPSKLAQAVGLALVSAIRNVPLDFEAMIWPEGTGREFVEAPPLLAQHVPYSPAAVKEIPVHAHESV
ncbi:DNA cytosine methyltransferase [Rhizobium sp.]|uniref:DNA cytosine methyltransferase n=1 Tax=Rhizobium sp. TaxID=391 RepID=UPI0028ACB803